MTGHRALIGSHPHLFLHIFQHWLDLLTLRYFPFSFHVSVKEEQQQRVFRANKLQRHQQRRTQNTDPTRIKPYKKKALLRFLTFRSAKSWPTRILFHWLPPHGWPLQDQESLQSWSSSVIPYHSNLSLVKHTYPLVLAAILRFFFCPDCLIEMHKACTHGYLIPSAVQTSVSPWDFCRYSP